MKFQNFMALLILLIPGESAFTQSFEGVWKGTSLCQVKNSPCHDEIVVYHIAKDSTGRSYNMIANKVVNGKEENMGTIPFTYDDKLKVFVSNDSVRNARWEFKVTGNVMKGTLIYNGNLYRMVDVKKEN